MFREERSDVMILIQDDLYDGSLFSNSVPARDGHWERGGTH